MREEADVVIYSFGLQCVMTTERSKTKYQTSPRITLLNEETLYTKEEV